MDFRKGKCLHRAVNSLKKARLRSIERIFTGQRMVKNSKVRIEDDGNIFGKHTIHKVIASLKN
jgi:hypothetical protein